jgi:hypothetical protein
MNGRVSPKPAALLLQEGVAFGMLCVFDQPCSAMVRYLCRDEDILHDVCCTGSSERGMARSTA